VPAAVSASPNAQTIVVACTGCHKRFRVDGKHARQQVRCPSCKALITIPMK